MRGDPVSAWTEGLQTNVTSGLISTSALLVGRGSTTLKYYRSSSELKSSWAHLFRVLKASPLCLILVMYKISMDSETVLPLFAYVIFEKTFSELPCASEL